MTIKARSVWTGKDESEQNKVRNVMGEFIGYRRSENTVRVAFDITKMWTPENNEVVEIIKQIAECEDKKYPHGLGRNMILLKHIYPIFKKYLDEHGFIPNPEDLKFAQREGKINEDKQKI